MISTWKNSTDKFDGDLNTNPPLRNDQHPRFAKTDPMQLCVDSSVIRLALTRAEFVPLIFTQPFKIQEERKSYGNFAKFAPLIKSYKKIGHKAPQCV